MDFVRLTRIVTGLDGTFGVLKYNESPYCVTLEPPDRDNERNVSCIPEGQYLCHKVTSPKYGNTWEIRGIHNRSKVLFHAGNVVEHTKGCVLLAEHFGKLYGDLAVLNSGKTFRNFMRISEHVKNLHLTVQECF